MMIERMFLTKVRTNDMIALWHLAENDFKTYCGRFTPTDYIVDEPKFREGNGVNFNTYFKLINENKIKDHNICGHCINRYVKDNCL